MQLLSECNWPKWVELTHWSWGIKVPQGLWVSCFWFNALGLTFFHCNKVPQGAWESAASNSMSWVQQFSVPTHCNQPTNSLGPTFFHYNKVPQGAWELPTSDSMSWVWQFSIPIKSPQGVGCVQLNAWEQLQCTTSFEYIDKWTLCTWKHALSHWECLKGNCSWF